MKIHYNRKTFPYKLILLFVFVVEMHYFNLFSLPSSLELLIYTNRSKWVAPLAITLAVVCWRNHRSVLAKYNSFLKKYLLITLALVCVIFIYSVMFYPLNSIITTYGLGVYYIYAFLAVPILYIFEVDGGIDKFMKMICLIAFIMYVISILESVYYIKTGGLLLGLSGIEINEGVMTRGGKFRIDAGAFGYIAVIYVIYRTYCKKHSSFKDMRNAFMFISLALLNIYFAGQSRVAIITLGLCIIALMWMGDGRRNKKILFSVIVAGVIAVAFLNGTISKVLNTFSISGDFAGSTIARLESWRYYFKCFLKNPFFGIGFAGDENYYNIVHGNSSTLFQTVRIIYDYSDCGIVGQLGKIGISIFFIYLWPLLRYVKRAFYCLKKNNPIPGALLVSLTVYLVATSFTLIILDSGRVIGWPLIIAIMEYYIQPRNRHIVEAENKKKVLNR